MHDISRGRVAVTGGAGLIGSAVVWALNRRGIDDVLVVDRLDESEKWRHLVPLRVADYAAADDFADALENRESAHRDVRTIIHLGACSATTERDAGYLLRNNFDYTKRLAMQAAARNLRFVYASSAATYGALEENLSDELELHTLRPLNAYAYSKHLFDVYALRTGLAQRCCGIKYFNVFGPNEDHKGDMRSVVLKAYEQIVQSGSVKLFKSYRPEFADGEQRRDFIYVKDAAEMTVHLAERGATGLVNVGSGVAQTWLALVRPIFATLGAPERIEFVDMPERLRGKYQYSTCARIERLRASGYDRPLTPLSEAVANYVREYLVPGRSLDPADAALKATASA